VPSPQGIVLSWQPAPRNVHDTMINGPMRYRIYLGRAPRDSETPGLVKETAATRYHLRGLDPGTYYVAVTTLTRDGLESEYSEEVVARLN
jgi:fibronectin type 3 domain-containing protein